MLSTAHRTPGLPGRAEHQQQQQQQQHWITATSTTATVNTNHKLSPGRLVSGSAGGGGGGAGAVPVSPADTNRSASDIPSPVSTTASQYHHQHHQQLQQQQHGEGRALSDVGTSSALEGDVDGHSHVYNYDAAHIRPSCIIRRGLLVHRNASGIVAGKKKPKHVFLCRPMTTDDIMFLRDSVAAAERESNQRSMDDVWLETTLQSASKAARDGEVELYGHLAYAAVTAHPLMVVAGGTSKIFIHMTNVAAVLEETDLGAACHFSILTTSRQEFKFSTETSPEYQLWIEDLLDAHYECRWADDARSIRSGLSSRSGRSARNRTTRYRSPVASVSQHSVSRDTSPNGVRSGLPRAASSNSIASKSYHLTGDGTYQAEPVYVQARPRGRSTPQTFAERTSSLAVPASFVGASGPGSFRSNIHSSSSSIHSGAGQVDPGGTEISEVSIAAEQTLTVPTQRATKLVQEEGTSLNTTPTLTNSSVPRTPESNPNNVDEELESIRAGSLVRFATNKELPKLAAESTGPVPMGRKMSFFKEGQFTQNSRKRGDSSFLRNPLTPPTSSSTTTMSRGGSATSAFESSAVLPRPILKSSAPQEQAEEETYIPPRSKSASPVAISPTDGRSKFSIAGFITNTSDKLKTQLSKIPGPSAKKGKLRRPASDSSINSESVRKSLLASISLVPSVRVLPSESLVSMIKHDPNYPPDVAKLDSDDLRMSRDVSKLPEDIAPVSEVELPAAQQQTGASKVGANGQSLEDGKLLPSEVTPALRSSPEPTESVRAGTPNGPSASAGSQTGLSHGGPAEEDSSSGSSSDEDDSDDSIKVSFAKKSSLHNEKRSSLLFNTNDQAGSKSSPRSSTTTGLNMTFTPSRSSSNRRGLSIGLLPSSSSPAPPSVTRRVARVLTDFTDGDIERDPSKSSQKQSETSSNSSIVITSEPDGSGAAQDASSGAQVADETTPVAADPKEESESASKSQELEAPQDMPEELNQEALHIESSQLENAAQSNVKPDAAELQQEVSSFALPSEALNKPLPPSPPRSPVAENEEVEYVAPSKPRRPKSSISNFQWPTIASKKRKESSPAIFGQTSLSEAVHNDPSTTEGESGMAAFKRRILALASPDASKSSKGEDEAQNAEVISEPVATSSQVTGSGAPYFSPRRGSKTRLFRFSMQKKRQLGGKPSTPAVTAIVEPALETSAGELAPVSEAVESPEESVREGPSTDDQSPAIPSLANTGEAGDQASSSKVDGQAAALPSPSNVDEVVDAQNSSTTANAVPGAEEEK